MKLHFAPEEFTARRARTLAGMADERLDGLLLFKPESHYWLTGYDTFGYCFFQCLLLAPDGTTRLLTRSADLRQAALTSIVDEVRVWRDGQDAAPAKELLALVADAGLLGKRLGVEWDTAGLTAANGQAICDVFDDRAQLLDASLLVSRLRLVKSAAELAYIRRAGELSDAALKAALDVTEPGADEALIKSRLVGAIYEGDGDDMGNPLIIGSGPYALLCRSHSGRRRLDAQDQLTLEWAGVYRRYHAAQMRTVCVGSATQRHQELFEAARDALLACEERLRPGGAVGEVYAAHARPLDVRGLAAHRLNACGYSLGAVYPPSWMDWPMCYADNPVVLEPDMIFFLHMILMDSDSGVAMTLGRTSRVTTGAAEPLSRTPLELLVR